MRRILIDYAVARGRQKRGGGQAIVSLDHDDALAIAGSQADELVALEEALARLQAINERQARIVECRFYGGTSVEETAEAPPSEYGRVNARRLICIGPPHERRQSRPLFVEAVKLGKGAHPC